MMYSREDVTFNSEGVDCKGWLYLPEQGTGEKKPAIVMAHGFSAVKEMYLGNYASLFAKEGFVVLVFDYRFLGESGGKPRQNIIPTEQHKDYKNAISWISSHPEVDSSRIGIWGSSYSGGHVLQVGATDPRVKVIVGQVPAINGFKSAQRLMRQDVLNAFIKNLGNYQTARYNGADITYIPVTAPEGEPCALPTPETFTFFTETSDQIAPNWKNKVSLESMAAFLEYNPGSYIELISPKPLLMVVAENDELASTDLALEAYEIAREPKKLVLVPGGHFDAYTGEGFEISGHAACDWFKKHL